MIRGLKGTIRNLDIGNVLIDVNGITYEVFVTYKTFEELNTKKGKEVYLYIYHLISDRNQKLFGFTKEEDRELFQFLRSLNGIGEMTVLKILSYLNAGELLEIVNKNEKSKLEKIPKVKGKTSEKILFEIKQNLKKFQNFVSDSSTKGIIESMDELAVMALMKLGFDEKSAINEVNKIIKSTGVKNTTDIIREVLKVT